MSHCILLRKSPLVLFVSLFIFLQSCKKDNPPSTSTTVTSGSISGSIEKDDKQILNYLMKNNIRATKTASGLYYFITQQGLGPHAKPGNKVTVNYTSKILDGNVFDSNTDPAYGHAKPFTFDVGKDKVIKGWDEAVQLMNLGTKAIIFIPSSLAFGKLGSGNAIAPNTILVMDLEVTGIGN